MTDSYWQLPLDVKGTDRRVRGQTVLQGHAEPLSGQGVTPSRSLHTAASNALTSYLPAAAPPPVTWLGRAPCPTQDNVSFQPS